MASWVDYTLTLASKTCLICSEDADELNLGILYDLKVFSVHHLCVLTGNGLRASGSYIRREGLLGYLLGDIYSAYKRYLSVECKYCKKYGASLQCKLCKTKYHLPCGLKNGDMVEMMGPFDSYCKNCYGRVSPIVKSNRIKHVCFFCRLSPAQGDRLFKPSCCRPLNYIIDYHCLKHYAQIACKAMTCPLCSNAKRFRTSVRKFGVYVPELEWECLMEESSDFTSFPLRCCAKVCTIKSNDTMSTVIVSCVICEQKIAHIECTFSRIFLCMECSQKCFLNLPVTGSNRGNIKIKDAFPWFYPLIASVKYGKAVERILVKVINFLEEKLDDRNNKASWHDVLDVEASNVIIANIKGCYEVALNENKENQPEDSGNVEEPPEK